MLSQIDWDNPLERSPAQRREMAGKVAIFVDSTEEIL
jgi:hypothetical protein